MNCRKCGAELHPDQKVCIQCGERTPAGGGFYVEEEKQWRPSRNMIWVAGAAIVLLIVALVINSLRTPPPGEVAEQWFKAMSARQIGQAQQLVTKKLESDLSSRNYDLRAVSDEYYSAVHMDAAEYEIGKPRLVPKKNPTRAETVVYLKYPDGHVNQLRVGMVKVGRAWRVNEIN